MNTFKISKGGEEMEIRYPQGAESLDDMMNKWGGEVVYELAIRGLTETMKRAARTAWNNYGREKTLERMEKWTPTHLVEESEAKKMAKAVASLSEQQRAELVKELASLGL